MDQEPEDRPFMINVVQGAQGAEFEFDTLSMPVGSITVWINQTDTPQVVVPLTRGIRHVMKLAPGGQVGHVWMLHTSMVGVFQWQLQAHPEAQLTITLEHSREKRPLFQGFTREYIQLDDIRISTLVGGHGRPLLLLHGYPQTHVCWHKIAPQLAQKYTVICPDLSGYGASDKPQGDAAHQRYSKRAMAEDQVQVMERLGFSRFAVVGHDRGARVAYRMALDHPERVEKLAVLDIIPTIETWERMDRQRGLSSYHWYFLAQPHDFPERLIGAAPEAFVRYTLESWCKMPDAMSEEAMTEYVSHFCLPETIHATCEDYRAGATVDVQHDEADRSNQRRIACPTLVLWGEQGHAPWDHLAIWQRWANDVRGGGLPCGHFLPEEAPEALLGALQEFL